MQIRPLLGVLILILGTISTTILASVAPREAFTQGIFVILGLVGYVLTQIPTQETYKIIALPSLILISLLLVVTLYAGHLSKGAVRWLTIGPIRVQLSEPAKPLLALALAWYISRYKLDSHRAILGLGVLSGLAVIPVFLQPDLGSALVLMTITGSAVLFSIKKPILLLPWIATGIAIIALVWNFFLYDYQKQRIFSFVNADANADSSYNARQALIAVGSGKIWGRGLGRGVQSALKFLPEHHTDFFFASYAEELGAIGVFVLFGLYTLLFFLLVQGIDTLPLFEAVYRYAIVSGLLFQTAVHIAMNIGLSPVTGIPLPFLSSGGSSFVALSIALGIAMRLQSPPKLKPLKELKYA